MFHRRRTSNPARHSMPTNLNPAAHSAAAQAFLKNQNPGPSLAAAAAGTALRTHRQPPTDVGQVETKRMQRKGSTGSNTGRGAAERPSSGLQRRASGGSLTERTLRSPSPGRTASPNRSGLALSIHAPPMPTMPPGGPGIPQTSHKRAASAETPLRVGSPPTVPGGRGVSLDRGLPSQTSPRGAGKTKLEQIKELERENSQRAVNFSRPLSPSPSSTPVRPQSTHSGWFAGPVVNEQAIKEMIGPKRPKTADGIPKPEVTGIQPHLQGVADRSTTPKRKRKKKLPLAGSYFAADTVGPKLTGTAVQPSEKETQISAPATEPVTSAQIGTNAVKPVEETQPEPSPSASPTSSHSTKQLQTPAANLLAQQLAPSRQEAAESERSTEQPNTSRKMESPQPLAAAAPPKEPVKKIVSLQAAPAVTGDLSGEDSVQRANSLSLARKPHFSITPVDLQNGIKHQPPPRSVSPVKSALKHSPSSSVRTASPVGPVQASHPNVPSEASITEAEETPKCKKSVRVSFDEAPSVVLSGLETSKHAPANAGRARTVPDDDFDDIMKPRPALPSFGSIRGRRKVEEEPPRPVRGIPESKPHSMGTSVSSLVDSETSKDHTVGGILAQDFALKHQAEEQAIPEEPQKPSVPEPERSQPSDDLPLPPVVTSIEGKGYISDSDSAYSNEPEASVHFPAESELKAQEEAKTAIPEPLAEPQPTETAETVAPPVVPVPTIAVLPATPAADEKKEQEPLFIVPGAFPDEPSIESEQRPVTDKQAAESLESSQTLVDDTESSKSEQAPLPAPAPVTVAPLTVPVIQDESDSSDTSSIYSDAAEEWEEEADGTYASLDAIVESPIEPPPGLAISSDLTKAPSPLAEMTTQDEVSPSPDAADWQKSTAYWRELSEQKRQEMEEAHLNEANGQPIGEDEEVPLDSNVQPRPATPPKSKMKKKKAVLAEPSTDEAAGVPTKASSETQPGQSASILRKTMRGSPEPELVPAMRRSMRATAEPEPEEGHILPTTLRTRGPVSGLSQSRWATSPPASPKGSSASKHAPKEPRGALQKKHIPPAVAREPLIGAVLPPKPSKNRPRAMPALTRRDSGDSDSSFKRAKRPSTANADGSYTLRRTMRQPAGPVEARPMFPDGLRKSTRFSLRSRSMSPTGSATGIGHGHHMRSSLRGSIDSGTPSLRNRGSPKSKSSKIPGFGKAKKKIKSMSPPPPYRSRFANDSDDEADDRAVPTTSRFQSRFADSDDELESPLPSSPDPGLPPGLRPARGIPRRRDSDSDSTDLEEEDGTSDALPSSRTHEKMTHPAVPTSKDIEAATNGKPTQGGALAAGTMRKDSAATNDLAASKHAPPAAAPAPERPKDKRRFSLPSFGRHNDKHRDSAVPPLPTFTHDPSRPGTSDSTTSKSRGPKLHRRSAPNALPNVAEGRKDEEASWPLAPPSRIGESDAGRPATSDAIVPGPDIKEISVGRPDMGKRSSSADADARLGVAYGRSGKKKRFPLLRKAFGLKD